MRRGLPEIERVRRRALKYLNRVHRLLESQPRLPGMAELSVNVAIDVLSRFQSVPDPVAVAKTHTSPSPTRRPRSAENVRTAISCFGIHVIPKEETQAKKVKP